MSTDYEDAWRKCQSEILKLKQRTDEMACVIRSLTPYSDLMVRKAVSFETAEFIYSKPEK